MKKIILLFPIIAACSNNDVESLNATPNLVELNTAKNEDKLYPPELVNHNFNYVEYSEMGLSYSRNSDITFQENGEWQHAHDGHWTGTYNRKWYVDKTSNSLVLIFNNRTAHVFDLKDGIWSSKYGCLLTWSDYLKYESGKELILDSKKDDNKNSTSTNESKSEVIIVREANIEMELLPKNINARILTSPNLNNVHPDWTPPSHIGLSYAFQAIKELETSKGEKYYQGNLLDDKYNILASDCVILANDWQSSK
jgi:hypothetical protein